MSHLYIDFDTIIKYTVIYVKKLILEVTKPITSYPYTAQIEILLNILELCATLLVDLLTVEIYNKAEDRIAIDMKSQLKFVPLNKNGHYDMVKDLYSMRDFLQDNGKDIDISEVNMK